MWVVYNETVAMFRAPSSWTLWRKRHHSGDWILVEKEELTMKMNTSRLFFVDTVQMNAPIQVTYLDIDVTVPGLQVDKKMRLKTAVQREQLREMFRE